MTCCMARASFSSRFWRFFSAFASFFSILRRRFSSLDSLWPSSVPPSPSSFSSSLDLASDAALAAAARDVGRAPATGIAFAPLVEALGSPEDDAAMGLVGLKPLMDGWMDGYQRRG